MWTIALTVSIVQILALIMFVRAAVKDFTNDQSDFIYSWRCPRDSMECRDESDLNWQGWTIYGILMAAHLLKDLINGLKLLILCGKRRHGLHSRTRYFVGGTFLTWVALFTLYASTVYNTAIARSNTDIIVNAVIILFIVDVDEYLYSAIVAASSFWGGSGGDDKETNDKVESLSTQVAELERQLKNRVEQLDKCSENLKNMKESKELLETRLEKLEMIVFAKQPDISQNPAEF